MRISMRDIFCDTYHIIGKAALGLGYRNVRVRRRPATYRYNAISTGCKN